MSSPQRIALVVLAAVVIVGGFVLAKGSGDDDSASSTPETTTQVAEQAQSAAQSTPAATTSTPKPKPAAPQVPTVRVVDGKPQGGIKKLTFDHDDQVRFKVVSDVADEIHVHGYDLMKDVKAGGSISYAFKASIEGKFEVELEDAGVQIAELTVEP